MASVVYAVTAKQEVIDKKKNDDNKVVNDWLKKLAENATILAKKRWSWDKVDLSVASIPNEVRNEVKKALGADIPIEMLIAAPTDQTKSRPGIKMAVDPEVLKKWYECVMAALNVGADISVQSRTNQADRLNKILNDAHWGTPARPAFDPDTGLPSTRSNPK